MPVWLWLLLGVIAAILLLLCCPVRVRLNGHAALPAGGMITLEIKAVFGLLFQDYRFSLHLLRSPYISLLWHKRTGEVRVVWDLGHTLLPKNRTGRWSKLILKSVGRHLHLKKFRVTGQVGIREDAFWTAMLTGAIGQAIYGYFLYLFNERQQPAVEVALLPNYTTTCFRLNLEGIGNWIPIQIISAVLFRRLLHKKGEKTACHIPLKTS